MTPEEEKEFDEKFGEIQKYHPAYWQEPDKDGISTAVPTKVTNETGNIKKHISQLLQQRDDEIKTHKLAIECIKEAHFQETQQRNKELKEKIEKLTRIPNQHYQVMSMDKYVLLKDIISLLENK